MDVINRILSIKFKKLGIKQESELYYVKEYKTSRLCIKMKNNYLVVKGVKTSHLIKIKNDNYISSAFSLSEINNFLKYYSKYFKTYYDFNLNSWKINKNIFNIYFLSYDKRKYLNNFIEISENTYDREVDLMGDVLHFLLKSKFINPNDIN